MPPLHDDVIKWKHFPRYWSFVRGIHRSPVNSPHRGQWRGALIFSLICARINGWVNNHEAGDLRRYRAHYEVSIMTQQTGNKPLIEPIVAKTILSIIAFKIFFYHNYLFLLIHLNMRSIPANSSKLFLYMSNLNANFDIIRLSETRLTVTSEYINNLDGYHHVPLVRPDHIHSGVSLFISTAINYRILNEISNK